MGKRKSNREIIESGKSGIEHAYIKPIGKELIPITKESGEKFVRKKYRIVRRFFRGKKYFVLAHEHPDSGLPSDLDLYTVIQERKRNKKGNLKGYFILQKDKETGEWQGTTYYVPSNNNKNFDEEIRQWDKKILSKGEDYLPTARELLEYADSLEINLRFHPAKDYYFNKGTGSYEKKDEHNLEGVVASILIGFSFLFLLAKVPSIGFVISNSTSINSKAGLFLILGLLFSLIVYFVLRISTRKVNRNA